MRKVIYTCIVDGYDELRQPEVVDDSYDYVCFTNDVSEDIIGVWKIRPIPFACNDSTRLSRYVKILPHLVLEDYDVSVWMDANIVVKGRAFYDAVESKVDSGCLMAQVPHIGRDCVYDEIARCYKNLKIGFQEASKQRRHLKDEGFPRHFGMMENNLIFRRHNDPLVIRLSEGWWKEYMAYSRRDQLALMPVLWKQGFMPDLLLGEGANARTADCLDVIHHPSVVKAARIKGVRRIPLKIRWTWRGAVASIFLR